MRRSVTLFFVVGLLCLVLAPHCAGAQGSTYLSGDEACERFAELWGGAAPGTYGVRLTSAQIGVLTDCAQDAGGSWFFPIGPGDTRLPQPVLSQEEEGRSVDFVIELNYELAGLWNTLDQTEDGGTAPDLLPPGGPPSIGDVLRQLCAEGWLDPATGKLTGGCGTPLDYYREQAYERVLVSWLEDPNHAELALYVQWWSARRLAVLTPAMTNGLVPPMVGAVQGALRIGVAPYPWEIVRAYTKALFAKWAIMAGRV